MTIRGVFYKLFLGSALPLVLCVAPSFAIEPTLTAISSMSLNYLSLPKGSHATYGTGTSKSNDYPYIVSIYDQDKNYRYFNPNKEATPELNLALRYLARTGGGAWVSGLTAEDNYIFRFNTADYYGYDSSLLPVSIWEPTSATSSNYDFAYKNGNDVSYYNINFVDSDKISWTVSSVASESAPVWYNADTQVSGTIKIRMPHIVADGSGNLSRNIEDVFLLMSILFLTDM